jgi:hypothetical protein
MRTQRERIAFDRTELEREHASARTALEATPEWAAYVKVHTQYTEHLVLYGTSLGGPEPVGIFGS